MEDLRATLVSLENVKSIVVFLKVVKSVGSVANANLNLSFRNCFRRSFDASVLKSPASRSGLLGLQGQSLTIVLICSV
jgi:hypothetical protein